MLNHSGIIGLPSMPIIVKSTMWARSLTCTTSSRCVWTFYKTPGHIWHKIKCR